MDAAARENAQARIDAIRWYHEFDFGDGLTTRSGSAEHTASHRRIWGFIERNLDRVDFRGKSVLDIGCWDGYWSFAAEKRGAASVLASDDLSQNWSVGQGVHLAKELLKSKIDLDLDLSIYDVGHRGKKYDIILCLGVYYHLQDPYYAFSQLRHCCHEKTVVLIEGNTADNLPNSTARIDFRDHESEFFPDLEYLKRLVLANYLNPHSIDKLPPPVSTVIPLPPVEPGRLGFRWRLAMVRRALFGDRSAIAAINEIVNPAPPPIPPLDLQSCSRVFLHCTPFAGHNPAQDYKPPFGLHSYDDRVATPKSV